MATFDNGESGLDVRNKINAAINKIDGVTAVTSINIDSGTIDGTVIGGATPAAGTFTTLSASSFDINGGTIDGVTIGGAVPGAGSFTTLSATGSVTLGDSATDVLTVTADIGSNLIPAIDNLYNLGAAGSEWNDLFIDGTANIDSLVADTADINGGTIDGANIGAAVAGTGRFTTLTTTGNVTLGDSASDTVTITADIASNLIPSVDNLYNLGGIGAEWNDLYIDGTANIDSLVADTADINGGTIDGTAIGNTTPAAGNFTTLDATGTVELGSGQGNTVNVKASYWNVRGGGDVPTFLNIDFPELSSGNSIIRFFRFTNTSGSKGIFLSRGDGTSTTDVFIGVDGQNSYFNSGNFGIGTSSPSIKLDVNSDSIRVRTAKTPTSSGATGTQGEIAWDANYVYVCVATNTWKRAALSTW